jgi:hypothetical protein
MPFFHFEETLKCFLEIRAKGKKKLKMDRESVQQTEPDEN